MRELLINGEKVDYQFDRTSTGEFEITVEGETFIVREWQKSFGSNSKRVNVNGKNISLWRAEEFVSFADVAANVKSTRSESRSKGGHADEGAMVSPMPGKILKIMTEAGKTVKKGEGLLVMEAMKMEHTIKANADGVVANVHCAEGDLVDGGVELVSIDSE